jgi:hypothetical protein
MRIRLMIEGLAKLVTTADHAVHHAWIAGTVDPVVERLGEV